MELHNAAETVALQKRQGMESENR